MIVFNSLPVDAPLRITSRYGARNTGIAGASTFHRGIDLGRDFSKPKTSILAVKAGTVVVNSYSNYRGWYIIIEHSKTYRTLYQHLESRSPIAAGAKVKAGDTLGIMGNSSNKKLLSVAVHLHFELHENGQPIDPEPYLTNIEKDITENMTEKELNALIDKRVKEILKGNNTQVSAWARDEYAEAVADNITDGTRPGGYATREEVAVMIERATK